MSAIITSRRRPSVTRLAARALAGSLLLLAGLAACRPAASPAASAPAATTPTAAPAQSSSEQAPAAAASPASLEHIKVVLSTLSTDAAPVVVAQEAGFTARHGIDAEIFVARSGPEAMAAVISQDAPIGSIGGN